MDYHNGIRSAYPDAMLTIEGETLDDLIVTNQETGESFEFDQVLVEAAAEAFALECKFNKLRAERNRLLAETDYFGMPDVTMTDEMRAYRQALRDLPANTADPANPVWPVKPGSEVAAEEPAAE